jgi:polysaccharide chain length determinant protein (PEP-CTERM system associated)
VTELAGQDSVLRPELALQVWQRRKWLAAAVFCTVVAAVLTAAWSLPDIYRASATVLVERQEVSEAFVRPSITAELETRIQTIQQRIMSRDRLGEVISRYGLYPELQGVVPIDAIVDRMRRDIIPLQLKGVDQASGRTATIAFSLGYRGRDPWTVAQVTNTLVDFYVQENTAARERQAARTVAFLGSQLADVKRELDQQERQTNDFTLRHTNELPQQLEANLAALDRLNTQLRLNGEYQLRSMERRERIEQELTDEAAAGSSEPTVSGAPPVPDPATELRTLKRQLAELRRRFTDDYPDVQRVNAEVKTLERQIAEGASLVEAVPREPDAGAVTRAAAARQVLAQIDNELASLRQQEAAIRRAIGEYEGRVESAPRRQYEVEQLSRGYDMVKERYQTLLKRYEDAQLAANLEQGQATEQFRVLDRAIPPRQPAAPDRLWLAVLGIVMAFGLAVGAVLAADRLDTTFHTADDLRAFVDVPALVAIRRVVTRAELRQQRRRFALVTVSAIVGLILVVGGSYYVASGNEQIVRLTARGAM